MNPGNGIHSLIHCNMPNPLRTTITLNLKTQASHGSTTLPHQYPSFIYFVAFGFLLSRSWIGFFFLFEIKFITLIVSFKGWWVYGVKILNFFFFFFFLLLNEKDELGNKMPGTWAFRIGFY